MARFLSILLFLLVSGSVFSQTHLQAAQKMKPGKAYENIHVEKLFGDARSTSFVIWIKEGVRKHKHAAHSETVYVLQGKGQMLLGEESLEIKKGDVIFIPEGTPHAVTVTKGPMKVISVQAPEFKGQDRIFLED